MKRGPKSKPIRAQAFQAALQKLKQERPNLKIKDLIEGLGVSTTMYYRYCRGIEAPKDNVIENAKRNLGLVWAFETTAEIMAPAVRLPEGRLTFSLDQPIMLKAETTVVVTPVRGPGNEMVITIDIESFRFVRK